MIWAGNVEPSHVLVAMGVPLDWAVGAVRASLGRENSPEDIDYVLQVLPPLVERLRRLSPAAVS